jgi:prepilin-type N-terminal cleavage/methylation domain-containing protein
MQGSRELRVESRMSARGGRSVIRPRLSTLDPRSPAAFTLLEVMMVVAIIGLMMTMSVPAILRTMHQEPLRKAVNDVMNICSHARAQAILHGVTTCVVFHPRSKEVTLTAITSTNAMDDFSSAGKTGGDRKTPAYDASALNSAKFSDSVTIDMLDINLTEYKDANEAQVRFFPNGTSDEMTLILHSGGQYQQVSLEVMTGLASLKAIR